MEIKDDSSTSRKAISWVVECKVESRLEARIIGKKSSKICRINSTPAPWVSLDWLKAINISVPQATKTALGMGGPISQSEIFFFFK